jgi:hypothetical protein
MDGYFNALDAQTTSGDGDDRATLLEGISDDLIDGANDAFDALDIFREFLWYEYGGRDVVSLDDEKKDTADLFREFSEADIDYTSASGLQTMIQDYEGIWNAFQDNSKTSLDRSLTLLSEWRGEGAESAKTYVEGLVNTYARVGTKLTVLESDLVAAREAIASARTDLTTLAASFKSAAEKYVRDKERQSDSAMYMVLAVAFGAAVTGLLAVATAGAGAAAGAAVFTVADGAIVAGQTAGAAISAGIAAKADVSGDSVSTIYQSFCDNADRIREGMFRTSDALVSRIRTETHNLPIVPESPDVSPGDAFDPSDFETDHTSKDTEKRVRDGNVDIQPDGDVSAGAQELTPLQ